MAKKKPMPQGKLDNPLLYRARQFRSNWRARAKKYGLQDNVPTAVEIQEWLEGEFCHMYAGKVVALCHYSGQTLGMFDAYQADHKVPLERGGSADLDNMALCTKQDNAQKGGLTDFEYNALMEAVKSFDPAAAKKFLSRLRMAGNQFNRFPRKS